MMALVALNRVPNSLKELRYPDVLKLIGSIVRWLLDDRLTVQLKAPCTVEMSLRRQEDKGRYILHLIGPAR